MNAGTRERMAAVAATARTSTDSQLMYFCAIKPGESVQTVRVCGRLTTGPALEACTEVLKELFGSTPSSGHAKLDLRSIREASDEGLGVLARGIVEHCQGRGGRVELHVDLNEITSRLLQLLGMSDKPGLITWSPKNACLVVRLQAAAA